ncbi:hypothetical protein KGF54_000735 [Candida jiufengensis]|uniref:uncharacterized protein n=1 Tax=Candida jiufengensis TaxID=497108 RepID=UPI002225490E|nr:uncharacterized protein KGF54_000735 [Candida jiufengensis]KAI5956260.1 hypothetical protein KGF54_000735 [Candida jiufengensis]
MFNRLIRSTNNLKYLNSSTSLRYSVSKTNQKYFRSHLHTASKLSLPRYSNSNSGSNRTRITKEITPEEVAKFKEAQERAKQAGSFDDINTNSYQQQQQNPYYSSPTSQSYIPKNTNGIITPQDPIYDILAEPTLVIERSFEYMNLFIGFEQANQYTIMNSAGNIIGFIREKDIGFSKVLSRQFFRIHRPFELEVFNVHGELALILKRPFTIINSHVKALLPGYDENNELMVETVGESQSLKGWHLFRRCYNLYKLEDEETNDYSQFGEINAPFLSFDFPIKNEDNSLISSIQRNWVGFGREMLSDTGIYVLKFDKQSFGNDYIDGKISNQGVTIDQRAIMLACTISIDFDYFSRHSSGHGLFSFGGSYDDV